MSDKRRYMALDLVSHEIQETLNHCLIDVESFVENPQDKTKLRFSVNYMHQVAGSLTMIEYHGAALLATEIEGFFEFVLNNDISNDNLKTVVSTAQSCIEGLAKHIDKALDFGEETPKDLLAPLNALRKIRKHTEDDFCLSDVFVPRTKPDIKQQAKPIGIKAADFPAAIHKLRQHFQKSLLALLKKEQQQTNTALIHKLVDGLFKLSRGAGSAPLWEASLALTGVMKAQTSELSADQLKTLRIIDAEFKALEAKGLEGLKQDADTKKLNALLYFIAVSSSESPAILKLQDDYNLVESLAPTANTAEAIKSVKTDHETVIEKAHELLASAQASIVAYVDHQFDTKLIAQLPDDFDKLSALLNEKPFAELLPLCNALKALLLLQIDKTEVTAWPEVEQVADVISGIDYFLECVSREEIKNLQGILEKTDTTLQALHFVKRGANYVYEVPKEQPKPAPAKPQIQLELPDDIDEDIFDIFLEEAEEVMEALQALLPKLEADLNDNDSLTDVRRSWHTLKGSGRMVGANQFGEFAWQIEKMLNGVLEDNAFTEGHLTIVSDATAKLPTLVNALKAKESLPVDALNSTFAAIGALAGGAPVETPVSQEPTKEPVIEDVDPELQEIFLEEADTYLAVFQSFLDEVDGDSEVKVSSDVQRALHTLKGSSHMAGIVQVAKLVTPLEALVMQLCNFGKTLDEAILVLLRGAASQLETMLQSLKQGQVINEEAVDALVQDIKTAQQQDLDGDESPAENYYQLMLHAAIEQLEVQAEQIDKIKSEGFSTAALEALASAMQALQEVAGKTETFAVEELSSALLTVYQSIDSEANWQAKLPSIEKAQDAFDDLFDVFAAHQIPLLDEAIIAELELAPVVEEAVEEIEAQADIIDVQPQDALTEALEAADPDVLELFAEEAEELQKGLVEHSESLNTQGLNDLAIAQLKLILHTMKGGARLAELHPLADEAHHFELLVESTKAQTEFDAFLAEANQFTLTLNTQLSQLLAFMKGDSLDVQAEPLEEESLLDAVVPEAQAEETPEALPELTAVDIELDDASLALAAEELDNFGQIPEITIQEAPVEFELESLDETKDIQVESLEEAVEETEVEIEPQLETEEPVEAELLEFVSEVSSVDTYLDAEEPIVEAPVSDGETIEPEPVESQVAETQSDYKPSIISVNWEKLAEEYHQADEDTFSFFIEEAEELIIQVEDSCQAWIKNPAESDTHCAAMKRQLHTLKGGARLTELAVLGDLTHDFESMIESAEANQNFDAAFFSKLPQYLASMQLSMDVLMNQGELPDVANLSVTAPEATQTQAPTFIGKHEPVDVSQLDADLVELFVDEAEEQVETIESSLSAIHEGQAQQAVEALKRALHTLKGGARLAGITGIGNLSHDFETFVIQSEREQQFDQDFIKGTQHYQEALSTGIADIKAAMAQTDELEVPSVVLSEGSETLNQTAITATQNFFDQLKKQGKNQKGEPIKIAANLLENLINLAGESSISRARIEEQVSDVNFSHEEMDATVDRLHSQLRRLEIETEAQISFRQEQVVNEGHENFDPLEMDRYTHMQQLSKSLIESASDLDDISETISNKMRDLETLIVQQSRLNTEMHESLMRAQMVPFSRMVPRLKRIVRQTATELGKQVSFEVENADGEMDRTILEKMIAPLEHMLRNAVDHGIESTETRLQKGKAQEGNIRLSLMREGGEILLTLSDDGGGINLEAVRATAEKRGLIQPGANVSDHDICQFILHPGFSTAKKVTQISGRGVGMDVVNSEIKQLGGSVEINSSPNGSKFLIRLPFTVSVNRALMVCIGQDTLAIPLNTIEGIVRISPFELENYYQEDAPLFSYAGQDYNIRYLGTLLDRQNKVHLDRIDQPVPVVLIRSKEYSFAIQVDRLLGSQEVVVKSLGPQFSMVEGLSGATVLGDGSVVIILDMPSLIRADISRGLETDDSLQDADSAFDENRKQHVMVVDDSVTVRKVTSRFLERTGFDVTLAKDGLDAVNQLQDMDALPDIILLDIEMPRMDGFEVVSRVRRDERLMQIPICMITSRTGEKHKQRALSLGANEYLGKPFQETQLLEAIKALTETAGSTM